MKTTKRFDEAVIKLANAFHNKELVPGWCASCAIGTLIGRTGKWYLYIFHNGLLNEKGLLEAREELESIDYNMNEVIRIESIFEYSYNHSREVLKNKKRESIFYVLCEVVKLLAEFDGITGVMDIESLLKQKTVSDGVETK